MLQFDEYKVKLNNLLPQLDDLEQALNLDEAARQVDFLEAQCAADGFWDNPENSQKVLQKLKQEKNKLDMLMKKAKMEQRKADNHRKIVVGANFETFLNEPRRYSEEQTRRIMQVAFATREVKNCMEQIERELARAEEKMPDTAINEEADEDENEEE